MKPNKAAANAHPMAQVHLAREYCSSPNALYSLALAKDFQRAMELAELAAKQGVSEGHLVLAQLYMEGLAGKKDLDLARKHVEQAAAGRLPEAIWLKAFWIMRREAGYTLAATKSIDVYRNAIAIEPQLAFLDSPFFLEPKPEAFPAETIMQLRTSPTADHIRILHQAVVADVIRRVRMKLGTTAIRRVIFFQDRESVVRISGPQIANKPDSFSLSISPT